MLVIVALGFTATIWLSAIGRWLTYPPNAQAADAIVVYGGGQERTTYGIDLYRRGLAPELWQTGDAGDYSPLVTLVRKQYLLPDTVEYLPSNSTWEDAHRVSDLAQRRHLGRILVVTSWYHGRRAMCALKNQLAGSGIDVYYDVPPSGVGGPNDWWKYASSRQQVVSELAKLPYYWFRYGVTFWNC